MGQRINELTANRRGFFTFTYHYEGWDYSGPCVSKWLHPFRDLIGKEAFGNPVIVQLHGAPVADEDLRYLKDIPSLKQVWLANTKVTDNGLHYLRACPNLRWLCLEHTSVTDEGMAEIRDLHKLTNLYLDGTLITDNGLEHLEKLTQLYELSLRDTAISDAGRRQLRAALPQCEIHTDFDSAGDSHP